MTIELGGGRWSRGILAACLAFGTSGCTAGETTPYLQTVTVVLQSDDLSINRKLAIRCVTNQDTKPGEAPFIPEFKTAIYHGQNYALLLDLSTDFYCGSPVIYDRSHQNLLLPGIFLLHFSKSGMVFDSISGATNDLLSDKWALRLDLFSVNYHEPGGELAASATINYHRTFDSFVADKPLRNGMIPFRRPVFYVADGGLLRSHRESAATLPPRASKLFRTLIDLARDQSLTRCDLESSVDLSELHLAPSKCSAGKNDRSRSRLAYSDSFLQRKDGSWLGPLIDPGWARLYSDDRISCVSNLVPCHDRYRLESFPELEINSSPKDEFARWSWQQRLIYVLNPSIETSYVDVACIKRVCHE